MCPPTFESGGGGWGQRYVCAPPHFQTQNLGLGIEPTDICDVTLAWLASRCWARQMCSVACTLLMASHLPRLRIFPYFPLPDQLYKLQCSTFCAAPVCRSRVTRRVLSGAKDHGDFLKKGGGGEDIIHKHPPPPWTLSA